MNVLHSINKNQSQDDIFFDVVGLAKYLSLSKKWIYERTCRNMIPHLKIGGALRFRKSEIDTWLDEQSVPVNE